jgi:hypothetical protein
MVFDLLPILHSDVNNSPGRDFADYQSFLQGGAQWCFHVGLANIF